MRRSCYLALVLAMSMASSVRALPPPPTTTVQLATDVLSDFAAGPLKDVPPSILLDAQGVIIVPRVIKAGFILGGRGGHGVVLTRDRSGAWSGPTFVDLGGASIGFQAGVESADVVLIVRSRKSLDRILEGKGKITLGADAAIAAGPIGRQAEAGTDAKLRAEIFSYSRSRGLFAGVALDGAGIVFDRSANDAFARDARPETTQLVATLLGRLTELTTPAKPAVILQGPTIVVPAPVIVPRPVGPPPPAPLPPAPVPAPPPPPDR